MFSPSRDFTHSDLLTSSFFVSVDTWSTSFLFAFVKVGSESGSCMCTCHIGLRRLFSLGNKVKDVRDVIGVGVRVQVR